jgi:4-hydroxybenzoate polyprenyltransferase
MVNMIAHISALLRLLRWQNLIIIAITQILTRECIMSPLLKKAYMELQMPGSLFALMVLSTVFIAAGGYAINDYFDRKIDRINKPDEMVVGNQIYPRHAMAYHMILTIAGLLMGIFVSVLLKQMYLSLVFFAVSGLLWFYSTTYKRELLLGNILVALLTALVPFLVLLFELPLLAHHYGSSAAPITRYLMIWVLGFCFFAFLINLIREIIKDSLDFEGDMAYGKKTIPVKWGVNPARWICAALSITTVLLIGTVWFMFLYDLFTLLYFIVMLLLPLGIILVLLLQHDFRNKLGKISFLLKMVMVNGLGYMIVANLLMNYLK